MIQPPDRSSGLALPPAPVPASSPVRIGDTAVHVWRGGAGADTRPALLSLHGWTDAGAVFGPLAREIGCGWHVVAPDAPGHGSTPWRRAPTYGAPRQAAAALPVLDALRHLAGRHAGVVVHGHSMGALAAARLAASRPDVVRHLVLEEPRVGEPGRSWRDALTEWYVERRMLAWLLRLRATSPEAMTAAARRMAPQWSPEEVELWARAKRDLSLAVLVVPLAHGAPLERLLARVTCPVTLVRGSATQDVVHDATCARLAARTRAGFDVVTFPTGHNLHREACGEFAGVLRGILSRS